MTPSSGSCLASFALLLAVALSGCRPPSSSDPAPAAGSPLDPIAESYVRLVLAVGQHDEGYVDAYYGPAEWRTAAEAGNRSLEAIRAEAEELVARLGGWEAEEEMTELRRRYLRRQLESLMARVDMLRGVELPFDDESRALYDAVAPTLGEEHLESVLDELDRALAAEGATEGSLAERYAAFRAGFVIPPERLDAVFRAAIEACRERTAAHIELPAGESFTVEYVTDKPWSGYNWYQGGYRSLIQVNTDLPIQIERAVDLACHEGYPGHHLYNALLEQRLVRERGWVELTVYPLFSPQSLIAEGSANYGIAMAFPGDQRLAFERDVLFPLAGLDPQRAAAYYRVLERADQLGYAGNEAARRYLNGEIDAAEAADWLTRYAASDPERARQRVRFFDAYRSYVINYNLGKDLVAAYVERAAGPLEEAGYEAARWSVFERLLSTPRLPSDLQRAPSGPPTSR